MSDTAHDTSVVVETKSDVKTQSNVLLDTPESMQTLSTQLFEMAQILRGLDTLNTTVDGERLEQIKCHNIDLIEGKLRVELDAELKLPLLVSIIGGANTGKSTLFNALAGEILATTTVTAGVTKHPLIYVHERWLSQFMNSSIFPHPTAYIGLADQLTFATQAPTEMSDELPESKLESGIEETYFKTIINHHQRSDLEHIALIDCPDLDSYDRRGARITQIINHRADLCILVTTPQKYKDAVLIEALSQQLEEQRRVFVLFNFTNDEMTHRTMREDLKRALPSAKLTLGSPLRSAASPEPERVLQQEASDALEAFFNDHPPLEVKKTLITHQLHHIIKSCQEIAGEYQDQTSRRNELIRELQQLVDSSLYAYRDQFKLPFPELGEALAIQISQLELRRIFRPQSSSEQGPKWSVFFAHGFGLAGEKLRSLFVRSFRFGAPPTHWETFWRQRDEQDLANLRHHAQLLRASMEQSLRLSAQDSLVAQQLLARFFNANELVKSDASLQRIFWETIESEPSVGQIIMKEAQELNQSKRGILRSSAAWIANGMKLMTGLLMAWLSFGFGVWDLLLFFPLGFIGGAYLITWLLYLRLRRRESAFKRQRIKMGRTILEEVQLKPMFGSVEKSDFNTEINKLTEHCKKMKEQLSSSAD